MAPHAAFKRALRFTLEHEAPKAVAEKLIAHGITGDPRALVDDPKDRGGRTAYGVTQGTFTRWLATQGLPDRNVWTILSGEIFAIYLERYWQPCAVLCPERLAIAVFDTGVLHGRGYAIPRLQLALGLKGDGVVGPMTRAAIEACEKDPKTEAEVLQAFLQARDDRYEELVGRDGSQRTFYDGWEHRLHDLETLLGMPQTLDPPRRVA